MSRRTGVRVLPRPHWEQVERETRVSVIESRRKGQWVCVGSRRLCTVWPSGNLGTVGDGAFGSKEDSLQ